MKGLLGFFVVIFVIGVSPSCMTLSPRSEKTGKPKLPQIIAHRGASAYAPENTLSSFRLAAEMQSEWFELDCTITKDKDIIICHDDTVDRTTNGKGRIQDMTVAELRELDAGQWKGNQFAGERLPTLEEALDLAKHLSVGVYVEIKSCADDTTLMQQIKESLADNCNITSATRKELLDRLAQAHTPNMELANLVLERIERKHMQKRVVIQSFSPIICLIAKEKAPNLRVELLGAPKQADDWENFLWWGLVAGVDGFNPEHTTLAPALLMTVHAMGKTVAVWTVDDEKAMKRYTNWGVDRIITNRPDLCRQVIRNASPSVSK